MNEKEAIYAHINELVSRASGKDPEEPSFPAIPRDPPKHYDYLEGLATRVDVGEVPGGTRLSFPKRIVLRLIRTLITQQRDFNRATVRALHALAADREHRFAAAQAGIASVELVIQEMKEELLGIRNEIQLIKEQMARQAARDKQDEDRLHQA
jgi:hypothetical protein